MKIKFIYNKKYDKKCRKRYADFIKKNGSVWGVKRDQSPVSIEKMVMTVDMKDIYNKYVKVFGIKPKVTGYIVSTPFSMINDDEKFDENGGKIFLSPFTKSPQIVVAHELFHIFFEKFTKRNIPNYDVSKEYFTVIMNDVIAPNISRGYPDHEKERKKIMKEWMKTKDIKKVISKFTK